MQSILSKSLVNTAAGLLSLVAGFGSSVIVARLLGVEGSGIVAYALWMMIVATLISDLGMPQAALRFMGQMDEAEGRRPGLLRALTRRFVASTSALAFCIAAYAAWQAASGNTTGALIWIATTALFLSYAYSTMALGAAQGLGRFHESSAYAAIGCLIQPFLVLAGAFVLGPAGAILGHVSRHLPQAVALRKYLRPTPKEPVPITPAMSGYARNNWLSGGLTAVLGSRVELAVIGLFFSLAQVGHYAVGSTITSMVIQLSFFLVATLVPHFAALHDRGDMEGLAKSYQRSLLGLALVLAPVCFGGAAISPVLIPTLFGEAFEPSVHLSEILLAFALAPALMMVPVRMMLARERSGALLWLSIGEGLVCIALLFAVVPFFGAVGAAWVRGLAGLGGLICYVWYCRSRLAMNVTLKGPFKVILSAILCALAARACLVFLPDLAGMLVGILAGGIVYVACLGALAAVPAEERGMIAEWAQAHLPARLAGFTSWLMFPRGT